MGKVLYESIVTFYGLHHDKGKLYTFLKTFQMAVPKNTIYRIMRIFDERMDTAPIIKMFENLKPKIFKAAEF